MPKLLTISIPTYNRKTYLENNLSKIQEEINILDSESQKKIKINVFNNASTDSTEAFLFTIRNSFPCDFEIINNIENIGAERNVLQCYENATTPYVWILGDDDVVLRGGLKLVLDILDKYDVDILALNNYWFTKNYEKKPKGKEKIGYKIYSNNLDFAKKTNVMLTFISGFIVRSGFGISYRDKILGTNIPQLSWILHLLKSGTCFIFVNNWVVAAKGSNSGGYGLVEVFGKNLVGITNFLLEKNLKIARVIQNGAIVNFFPNFILESRRGHGNFLDEDMYLGLKEAYSSNWRYYLFLSPLLHLPLLLTGYYMLALKILRRIFRFILI